MKFQKGEVMLAIMVVILVVMWAWNGHTGMGHMEMAAHGSPQAAEAPKNDMQDNKGTTGNSQPEDWTELSAQQVHGHNKL